MEDVPELYAQPHDPARPAVGSDACRKELHGRVADPLPVAPGHPAKEDGESVRNGTANLVVIVEPLAGERPVTVTDRRTIPDLAARVTSLCDELDPTADVIRVALDHLDTHTFGSRSPTYPAAEAWRWRRRLDFHDTPKHASWLNMAECELRVPSRPCLSRRPADTGKSTTAVKAWVEDRNRAEAEINWTFRVADARKKLAFLDPKTPAADH